MLGVNVCHVLDLGLILEVGEGVGGHLGGCCGRNGGGVIGVGLRLYVELLESKSMKKWLLVNDLKVEIEEYEVEEVLEGRGGGCLDRIVGVRKLWSRRNFQDKLPA